LGNVFIEEFFDDQTFRDNQNEFGGIVETPDASDYEDMSEHFETVIINENANHSTFLNSNGNIIVACILLSFFRQISANQARICSVWL
jgi:hypothetical protein